MQPVIYYEGERIYFRPIEVEDAPALQRWENDPRIWSSTSLRPPQSVHHERQWVEGRKPAADEYVFGLVVKQGDRLIGLCDLRHISPVDRRATFGIMIGEVDQQDQGYGGEAVRLILRFAFEELNLNRVQLSVSASNPRAIHVYESAGFELEARFREAEFRQGRYDDELWYAALRSKWQEADRAGTARLAERRGEPCNP